MYVKETLLYIISDLRVALPFIKVNGTLRGLSLKIRYDTVKSHYCVALEYSMKKLHDRVSRWDARVVLIPLRRLVTVRFIYDARIAFYVTNISISDLTNIDGWMMK